MEIACFVCPTNKHKQIKKKQKMFNLREAANPQVWEAQRKKKKTASTINQLRKWLQTNELIDWSSQLCSVFCM